MGKKLILLGLAVTALAAFALPAAASASPQLAEGATPLAENATFALTSTNVVATKTAFGDMRCAHVEFLASLDENPGTSIKAHGISGAAGPCIIGTTFVQATKPTLVSLATTGKGEGTLTLSFILEVGSVQCPYEGTGKFTYVLGSDDLNIAGINLKSPCGGEAGATPVFHARFTMRTSGGGSPVIVR